VSYLHEGKYVEAIAATERESADWAKSLVSANGLWGLHRTAEADAALNEMIKKSADTGAYQIAEVFSFRGDKDQAFAWLDRARRQLDGGLSYYTNDPFLDNLRSDPRWAAFQRTMGWADDQLK
jgi:serine/threonine-protein kinase